MQGLPARLGRARLNRFETSVDRRRDVCYKPEMESNSLSFKGILSLALILVSADALAAGAKSTPKAPKTSEEASEGKQASMGKDKTGIEAYLKERLSSIRARHKAQGDFNADEGQQWQEFWNKVKEERELFEVRVAKQRLNVFESLDSLERTEHGKTIADFERMQSNVLKSFEAAQRAKMAAFFTAQAGRTKAFAARQEKDRVSFAEEAEASWRLLKSGLPSSPATRP